jgi:hypothetical protein
MMERIRWGLSIELDCKEVADNLYHQLPIMIAVGPNMFANNVLIVKMGLRRKRRISHSRVRNEEQEP